MIIGVPKEIKKDEYRVGLTAADVEVLSSHNHTVVVEKDCGRGSGIEDSEYEQAGAKSFPHGKRSTLKPR